ncbi:hypothetical protein SSPSH_003500 [Salinisphaera shabanensis E1L3A]|uniref:Uncharacterized protein n=1 Tax=Salinisphaera shabanensis E1L3A TaxID=1033802 RepID=U2EH62_9GAMM|nr:hypothetical protein SSPSH_003500 [Salinisphaera shabanensis E1L3A]
MRFVIIPALQSIPGALFFATLRVDKADSLYRPIRPLYNWVNQNPFLASVIVALYVIGLNAIISGVHRLAKGSERVEIKDLLRLFEVLETIVGSKSKRFGEYVSTSYKKPRSEFSAEATFRNITQPDQQIALLNIGIQTFFDAIDRHDTNIATAIVSVSENGAPESWFHFHPDSKPPLATPEELAKPDSTVMHAIKRRRMVIIEDIAAEAKKPDRSRRYRKVENEDEEGSLICYPIIDGSSNKVPYVVSIKADRKKYFRKHHSEFYSWVLETFEVRIRLEHSLLLLRSLADECN